jgi:hypothetical protein
MPSTRAAALQEETDKKAPPREVGPGEAKGEKNRYN